MGHVPTFSATFQEQNIMAGRKEASGLRLACDGCHVRKLRCSRGSTACARCLRDGVQCVYSPSRKAGRPSKAGQITSRAIEKNSDAKAAEMLESPRENPAEYSAAQQPEQASHAAFWAHLGTDEYANLPLEAFWSEPYDSGEEANNADGEDQYGNMTMAIGSDAFPNDNLTINQSQDILSTYNDSSNNFESKQNRRASGNTMESMSLITPPRERSYSDTEAPAAAICNKIQRLSELQQQLFAQRSGIADPSCDDCLSQAIDVDAVIGIGQAMLELTRNLFAIFAAVRPQDPIHKFGGEYDPATMLLAISPLLLVVTTYNDILELIRTALDEISVSKLSQASGAHTQQPNHNALFHGMALKVGKLDLDIPLRLIIWMSIIEYQLAPLERSLQLIHSNHLQNQVPDISKGILATSVDGLRSAIQEVLNKVSNLIQQAKLPDLGGEACL